MANNIPQRDVLWLLILPQGKLFYVRKDAVSNVYGRIILLEIPHSEKRCFKIHHTSICPKLLPLQVTSKEQESTKPEKDETKNDRSPKLPSTANIACIGQDQPKAVLLQTASAKISSVKTHNYSD